MPVADLLAERDGAFGAAVDPTLLARLDLKLGDRVSVGSATFQIRSVVDAEPDKLAGGIGLGPRFLVSEAALARDRAVAARQPGALDLSGEAAGQRGRRSRRRRADRRCANAALPEAGWEIRSRSNASPQLERTISRFTQFLTLVGLAALLVGGVGVANAVKSHIDRRRDVIAAFKALGATGRDVFTIYLTQVIVLAVIGSVIGLAVGAALPFVIVGMFGKLLPLPVVPALHPGRTRAVVRLRPADRARLRAVAARPGPRRAGGGAVSRDRDRRVAPAALALSRADGRGDRAAGRGGDRACLRQAGRDRVRRVLDRGVCAAARHRRRADGAGAPAAAQPHHHAAAGDRQHLPARRVDAVGGDVARPRSRRCWSRSPRSTAICGGNSWRRCRTARRRSISSIFPPPKPAASARSSSRPRRNRRSRTCRCCAGASSQPAASRRKTSTPRPTANGCCRATAA